MLQMILAKTPVYVWAILAFLLYRGVLASRARQLTLKSAGIMPLVMTALSAQSVFGVFGLNLLTALCWGGALAAVALLSARNGSGVVRVPGTDLLEFRGSWLPLMYMMLIFVAKYAINVMLAVNPALAGTPVFAAVVSIVLGAFSGVFAGNMLKALQAFRSAETAAVPA